MRGYLLSHLIENLHKYPALPKFSLNKMEHEDVDSYYYKSSSFRHDPDYYETLTNSMFFMAFGGYYDFKPCRYLPHNLFDKLLRKPFYWRYRLKRKRNKDFSNQIFIFQHDNFRFWEVLCSGCIAINLDLKFWNFLLPESPVNGVHYIGVKCLNDDLESILVNLNDVQIQNIGNEGRKWVIDNYSPVAQANRLLNYLDGTQ